MSSDPDSESKSEALELKKRGNEALNKGDVESAINFYSQAIEKDPGNAVFYSNRSAAHLKLKDAESATADGRKVVELDPSWGKGYSRLASALLELKQPYEAKEVALKGLEVDPSNPSLAVLKTKASNRIGLGILRGFWFGKVHEELGGFVQQFEFVSDEDVRITVMNNTLDAKYSFDTSAELWHLDFAVPSQPHQPPIRHIMRFESENNEMRICSPYLVQHDQRPTDFTGPSMVLMTRGKYELPQEELELRAALQTMPLDARCVSFCKELLESSIPSSSLHPTDADTKEDMERKMKLSVLFQRDYANLQQRLGEDAEDKVKSLVTGVPSERADPTDEFSAAPSAELKAQVTELRVQMVKVGILPAEMLGVDDADKANTDTTRETSTTTSEAAAAVPAVQASTPSPRSVDENIKEQKTAKKMDKPKEATVDVSLVIGAVVVVGVVLAVVSFAVSRRR